MFQLEIAKTPPGSLLQEIAKIPRSPLLHPASLSLSLSKNSANDSKSAGPPPVKMPSPSPPPGSTLFKQGTRAPVGGTRAPAEKVAIPTTVGPYNSKSSQQSRNSLATPPLRPISSPNIDSPDDAIQEMLVAKLENFYQVVNPGQCNDNSFALPLGMCLIVSLLLTWRQVIRSKGSSRKIGETIQQQFGAFESGVARKVRCGSYNSWRWNQKVVSWRWNQKVQVLRFLWLICVRPSIFFKTLIIYIDLNNYMILNSTYMKVAIALLYHLLYLVFSIA